MRMKKKNYIKLLEEEIERRHEELANMEFGTEEYDKASDSITKLTRQLNEIKSRKGDQWIKIASIGLSTGTAIWWALTSFVYEERGFVKSSVGKMTNKLIEKIARH
jgi:DNA polymerase/3'-5' exonuclease PolX